MQATKIQSYKDLKVWQKSVELATQVYALTESFPSSETYGIISQMRRAAISIPSNIAEGSRRGTKKDYCHFLLIAFGSGSELETQVLIAKNLNFCKSSETNAVETSLEEVMKMLNGLIQKLKE